MVKSGEGNQSPHTPSKDTLDGSSVGRVSTDNVPSKESNYVNMLNNNPANGNYVCLNGTDKPPTAARNQLNSDSSYSIDVLSGGESESDSLRKRKPSQIDTLDRLIRPRFVENGNVNEHGGETLQQNRSKSYPLDVIFFIAKELLMTERTYKKDLEVITTLLREEVSMDSTKKWYNEFLWRPLEAISAHQLSFLQALEIKLGVRTPLNENNNLKERKGSLGTQSDVHAIGQVMLDCLVESLPWYEKWVAGHLNSLQALEQACMESSTLERICRDIETQQKSCHLPLYTFMLKPLYRLLHYKFLLERSAEVYSTTDIDHQTVKDCLSNMEDICEKIKSVLPISLNYIYLCLLRRDVEGLDNLVKSERQFLKQGCLFKYTSKGPQQRMFFLFSDILVYSNKCSGSQQQFKVHGIIPVQNLQVEQAEYTNSFSIYGGGRAMTLSANTSYDRDSWINTLEEASVSVQNSPQDDSSLSCNLTTSSSAEELSENNEGVAIHIQKNNTLAHVCWHRNTSLSWKQLEITMENQLSGYLLRKFKNSYGWQRLWVVFASFCLYFYKTYHDDYPLASLPLLGYAITKPNERDGINKDFVFKLIFKNHVYFFRAESDYTFNRWMEVIGSSTNAQQQQ